MDELSTLREHLERYRGVTLQTLDFVPADKLGWRPSGEQSTVGQELAHIGQTEDYYRAGLFTGDWDIERLRFPNEPLTKEAVRDLLVRTRAELWSALETVTIVDLGATVSVPSLPVSWPLRAWLWHIVEHEVHHKGKAAAYLRALGVEPPYFAAALTPGQRPDHEFAKKLRASAVS